MIKVLTLTHSPRRTQAKIDEKYIDIPIKNHYEQLKYLFALCSPSVKRLPLVLGGGLKFLQYFDQTALSMLWNCVLKRFVFTAIKFTSKYFSFRSLFYLGRAFPKSEVWYRIFGTRLKVMNYFRTQNLMTWLVPSIMVRVTMNHGITLKFRNGIKFRHNYVTGPRSTFCNKAVLSDTRPLVVTTLNEIPILFIASYKTSWFNNGNNQTSLIWTFLTL